VGLALPIVFFALRHQINQGCRPSIQLIAMAGFSAIPRLPDAENCQHWQNGIATFAR
jgi:hypothetical protein